MCELMEESELEEGKKRREIVLSLMKERQGRVQSSECMTAICLVFSRSGSERSTCLRGCGIFQLSEK